MIMFANSLRRFLSLFSPQLESSSMSPDYVSMILRECGNYQTDAYLTLFRSWSADFLEQSNQSVESFFDQIKVSCLMHNRLITPPEHEFIILETVDRKNKIRCIIVERNVIINNDDEKSLPKTPERPGIVESMKGILSIPSDLASLEEGNASMVSLSPMDKLTLSSAKAATIASKSIDKFQRYNESPAIDQFLGENYVFGLDRQGECVRYFKPKFQLSLLDVAILADVIHQEYPLYVLLTESCYFFSAVLYQVLEQLHEATESCTFGALTPSITQDGSKVLIHNSSLSNKFGRSRGALISLANQELIDNVISKFQNARKEEVEKMSRRRLSMQHMSTMVAATMRKRTNTIVNQPE